MRLAKVLLACSAEYIQALACRFQQSRVMHEGLHVKCPDTEPVSSIFEHLLHNMTSSQELGVADA